ncbi:hypothetical protein EPO17_03075 [Patescibacteria group bacterium]|nr:MAG: hypothetical protein EPO17_03075 [Patescibacteria group bacterium]
MYHFLPLAEKKLLRREYRIRFATVVLATLSFLVVLGGAFLLPSWFLADIKEQTVEKRMEIVQNAMAKKQDQQLNLVLENTKRELKLLRTGEDFLPFRGVLEAIIDNKTFGVSLQKFSFGRISVEGDMAVIVQGVSRDRDALVNFRKNLEREKMFTRVDLPIASLAKGRDAEFNIELTAVTPKQ